MIVSTNKAELEQLKGEWCDISLSNNATIERYIGNIYILILKA